MTRRPVQQARRITDRQLVSWPEKEAFTWSPTRATLADVREILVGTVVLMLCFAAIVAGLFVLSGMAA